MKRGEVYLVRLDPVEGSEQAGARPCVVVTRDAINQYSTVVTVSPFTDAANLKRQYPSDVLVVAPEGGLTMDSCVLTAQTRAVSKRRMVRYLGSLSPETMSKVDAALQVTLALPRGG